MVWCVRVRKIIKNPESITTEVQVVVIGHNNHNNHNNNNSTVVVVWWLGTAEPMQLVLILAQLFQLCPHPQYQTEAVKLLVILQEKVDVFLEYK